MIKKTAVFVALIVAMFTLLRLNFFSHTSFLSASNYVKMSFEGFKQNVSNFSQKYFQQAKMIEALKKDNEKLKKENLTLNAFAKEVVNLSKFKKYNKKFQPKTLTVRAISYASLPDFNKIWVDFSDFNSSKIYGLIYNNVTAGIVVENNGIQSLALLNGDNKCSYAVYIGKKEHPGVAIGKRRDLMVVRYIPSWANISVGDVVFTSGLDNIFFEGIRVGRVTEIKVFDLYKEAEIKPFYKSSKPDYFYLVLSPR